MRVELERVTLEVEDHGEGVPVILLHGFPLSSQMWTPVRTAVEQAARLITPDLRGFGRSDAGGGDYDIDTLAGDVLDLADAFGVERFVLGGHSMGGYVALRAVRRDPGRALGLILVDTRADADGLEARERRNAAIESIRRSGSAGFLNEFLPNLLGPSSRARSPRLLEEIRAQAANVPDHALVGCLAGMRDRLDSSDLLPSLGVPALVIVGQEDSLTPPALARAMAAAIPGALLAEIPAAGHTPSVERPIPTAEAILTFLKANFATAPMPMPTPIRPRAPR